MKRFACLLLTLALLAGTLAACQQEEEPSSSVSSAAATAAPQETATPAPTPTAATTAAPSKAPEATPTPAPEVGQELSMVEEEDGEFGLPGLTLGMSLEEVETAAALFPDEPQLELVEEREDAHFQTTIALYRMGAQTMAGRDFTRKLTFWDGELHSLSLELLAEGGEDLEPVFQSLEEELRARWSVAMENELNVTQAPALDNGETYQRSRFVRVESDTGETAMLLNALDQETETGYRTVCLGVDISLPY